MKTKYINIHSNTKKVLVSIVITRGSYHPLIILKIGKRKESKIYLAFPAWTK